MRTCRNCESQLIPKDRNLGCLRCRSAYLDFHFLEKIFRPIDFQKLVTESKQLTSKSSQNCVLCNKQSALHFIGTDIQVESCYPCQKVWFDAEELKKFQTYMQRRNNGKIIFLNGEVSNVPFSNYIFDETIDNNTFLTRPSAGLITELAYFEMFSNWSLNKITDSNFFKRNPIITFCIIVAILIWYFKSSP